MKTYLHGSFKRKTNAQKKASEVASKYPSSKIEIKETDGNKRDVRFVVVRKTGRR